MKNQILVGVMLLAFAPLPPAKGSGDSGSATVAVAAAPLESKAYRATDWGDKKTRAGRPGIVTTVMPARNWLC